MVKQMAWLAMPLILVTAAIYLVAVLVWNGSGSLQHTDAASQWLAGLVTIALAIAAGMGWARYNRRARFIELSELFASVHAEITSKEIIALVAEGGSNLGAVDTKVLKETYLRNSARIDVIRKFEQSSIDLALADLQEFADRSGVVGDAGNPFPKLFKRVVEALQDLEGVLPDDDPVVAAQKQANNKTFRSGHVKDESVQQLYSEVAEFFAGRSLLRDEEADVVVGGLPYQRVRLTQGGQAIELLSRGADGVAFDQVWIAGSGTGDPLAAGSEHRHRKDGAGKAQRCHFSLKSTRDQILSDARSRAGGGEPNGRFLGQALLTYFQTVTDLPGAITCPHCRDLQSFNNAARARVSS